MPDIEKTTHAYKTVDGTPILADVYRASTSGTAPALMWIHGGALIMGSRADLQDYQMRRYLAAGFTVVAIDYRLAPETKLPSIIDDLRDAWRWVLETGPDLFGLDGERVAVAGHSAGGYLTLMSGFGNTPRPKALVPFYGYGDITGAWYTRPDPFYSTEFPPVPIAEALTGISQGVVTAGPRETKRFLYYLHTRQTGRWPLEVAGHDADREDGWFTPYCPIRNVAADYPPTLLIHGVPDTDVPYAESAAMAETLAENGVVHELVTLPTLGHGFDSAEGAAESPEIGAVFDKVTAFLRTHV